MPIVDGFAVKMSMLNRQFRQSTLWTSGCGSDSPSFQRVQLTHLWVQQTTNLITQWRQRNGLFIRLPAIFSSFLGSLPNTSKLFQTLHVGLGTDPYHNKRMPQMLFPPLPINVGYRQVCDQQGRWKGSRVVANPYITPVDWTRIDSHHLPHTL